MVKTIGAGKVSSLNMQKWNKTITTQGNLTKHGKIILLAPNIIEI
jgi:hypothetical protein